MCVTECMRKINWLDRPEPIPNLATVGLSNSRPYTHTRSCVQLMLTLIIKSAIGLQLNCMDDNEDLSARHQTAKKHNHERSPVTGSTIRPTVSLYYTFRTYDLSFKVVVMGQYGYCVDDNRICFGLFPLRGIHSLTSASAAE